MSTLVYNGHLKLNMSKTKLLVFLPKLAPPTHVPIAVRVLTLIFLLARVVNHEVIHDWLPLSPHIQFISKSRWWYLLNTIRIRPLLATITATIWCKANASVCSFLYLLNCSFCSYLSYLLAFLPFHWLFST